jgi:hypothetical protein
LTENISAQQFRDLIDSLVTPIAGQYPRPWMTASNNPRAARVFLVGYNQATRYDSATVNEMVGNRKGYIRCLFNDQPSEGISCHALHTHVLESLNQDPSRTRRKINQIKESLASLNITDVLETNIFCYSTRSAAELRENPQGAERGRKIFCNLLKHVRPKVIIAHGKKTVEVLEAMLCSQFPAVSSRTDQWVWNSEETQRELDSKPYSPLVFTIRSLSSRDWPRWEENAQSAIKSMSDKIDKFLNQNA